MWINIDLVLLLKRRQTRFFNSPKTCKTRRWSLLLDQTFIFFHWKEMEIAGYPWSETGPKGFYGPFIPKQMQCWEKFRYCLSRSFSHLDGAHSSFNWRLMTKGAPCFPAECLYPVGTSSKGGSYSSSFDLLWDINYGPVVIIIITQVVQSNLS